MSWKQPPALASEEWCTVPYSIRPKTPIDALDTILLQFSACYALRTRWRDMIETSDPEANAVRAQVKIEAETLLSRLDWFWGNYGDWLQSSDSLHGGPPPEAAEPPLSLRKGSTFTSPTGFRDTFAARVVAEYNTGNILMYGVLRSIHPMMYRFEEEITLHGESILQAVEYHEKCGCACGSRSIILPMKQLIMDATSEAQREQAQTALRRWGERRGIAQLCDLEVEIGTSEGHCTPFGYDIAGYDIPEYPEMHATP